MWKENFPRSLKKKSPNVVICDNALYKIAFLLLYNTYIYPSSQSAGKIFLLNGRAHTNLQFSLQKDTLRDRYGEK